MVFFPIIADIFGMRKGEDPPPPAARRSALLPRPEHQGGGEGEQADVDPETVQAAYDQTMQALGQ